MKGKYLLLTLLLLSLDVSLPLIYAYAMSHGPAWVQYARGDCLTTSLVLCGVFSAVAAIQSLTLWLWTEGDR